MKTATFLAVILAGLMLSSFTLYNSIKWEIADGYSIKFTSKNPEGIFSDFSGDVHFDPSDLGSSKFDLTIEVSSINTGNGMKNKHAVSPKWFDAEQFPEIRFVSKSFAQTESGYAVTGDMAIHGVTKEMTIPFTFENNTFVSNFEVNRTDFNIGGTKGMSAKAATVLTLDVSVPVTKP
ncbi:MAG: YceI family protein [Bacteroidota bacterium]